MLFEDALVIEVCGSLWFRGKTLRIACARTRTHASGSGHTFPPNACTVTSNQPRPHFVFGFAEKQVLAIK